MIRGLIRIGLGVMAFAVTGLLVVDTEMGGDHRLTLRSALIVGAGICASGIVLGGLSKLRLIGFGRRCAACRHSVSRGHIYCEDHFQEAVDRGRDKLAAL